jgi:Wiskott-Aldrich syndrome protein
MWYIYLQMKKLDPEMKALFEQIGIDDQSQMDEETMDFIYDFVDKHGGLNAVREDLARRKPPAAPTHQAGLYNVAL